MKKIIILVILSFILLASYSPVYAARTPTTDWYKDGDSDCADNGGTNQGCFLLQFFYVTGRAVSDVTMGMDTAYFDPNGIAYKSSILGRVNDGIALAYAQPPASTGEYIAYLSNKAGIVHPAYAQGIGFSGLSPIIDIWRAFRNIAYGFLILIMVVVGFMILFRWKIDPRTVITIQSALPKIVVTLILITFSYAIVGLMIDVMYLAIYVSIFALGKAGPGNLDIVQNFTGGGLPNLFSAVFQTGINGVDDIVNFLIGTNPALVMGLGAAIGSAAGLVIGGLVGLFIGVGIGGAAGAILPQVIVGAIVAIALVILFFRIFFLLLSAWVQVFISLIFGPLQLMLGAIPGVNSFSGWFKNLVANLAVFPITMLLLLVGAFLTESGNGGKLWTPPGISGFGGSPQGAGVAGLIGLGVLIVIPSIANGFKQTIKATSVIPVSGGALLGTVASPISTGWNLFHQYSALQSFRKRTPPVLGGEQ